MPYDDSTSNFTSFVPAGIGFGIAGKRLYQAYNRIPSLNQSSIPKATDISDAMASGGLYRSSVDINQRYINSIEDLVASGATSGLPPEAVDEAMRASLLKAKGLSTAEIDMLSEQVLAAYRGNVDPLASGIQRGGIDIAKSAVTKYGDPRLFYENIRNFGRGFPAGVKFTQEELFALSGKGYEVAGGILYDEMKLGAEFLGRLPEGWTAENIKYYKYPTIEGLGEAMQMRANLVHPELAAPVPVDIPLTPGWFRGGKNLESLYATNKVIAGSEAINLSEYMVRQFGTAEGELSLNALLEQTRGLSKSAMKARVLEFNEELSRYMVYTQHVNTPGNIIGAAIQQSTAVIPGFAEMADQDAKLRSLYQNGFSPTGTPATIAKGKVMLYDPRELWPDPELFPIERRPLQPLRTDIDATAEAARRMRTTFGVGGWFQRGKPWDMSSNWESGIYGRGKIAPQIGIAYATNKGALYSALQQANLGQEQLLLNKEIMPMYQSQRIMEAIVPGSEYIASGAMKDWITETIKQGKAGKAFPLIPGQRIGYDVRSMTEILAGDLPNVRQEIIGASPFTYAGGKQGFRLDIRETIDAGEITKVFGQSKMTIRPRGGDYLEYIAKQAGIPFLGSNVDGFTYVDELRKNRQYLRMQMRSGLALTAAQALEQGKIASKFAPEVREYLAGPTGQTELEVLRKAKRWGLPLGPIGGAMPEALSKADFATFLEQASQAGFNTGALEKELRAAPYVLGLQTSYPGAFKHMGAYGLGGTMEPRGFMQLLAKGPEYQAITKELAMSMRGYGQEITELENIIGSMAGKDFGVPAVGIRDINLSAKSVTSGTGLMREKGFMLDIGRPIKEFGGASKIYVPGFRDLRGMDLWRMSGGEIKPKSLLKSYSNFVAAANENITTKAGLEQLENAAKALKLDAYSAMSVALAGKSKGGPQGALRGQMAGSAFVPATSIDPIPADLKGKIAQIEANTIEISKQAAEEMYVDRISKAISTEEANLIRAEQKAFMAGQKAPFLMGRHGLIGPYSLQPVWGKLATKGGEGMFINVPAQIKMSLEAMTSKGAYNWAADISPLMGMAGDLDDDRYIIKNIGDRKANTAVRDLLNTGAHMKDYRRFVAEATTLKKLAEGQASGEAAKILQQTDMDKLVLGSTRLRMGVGKELGQLSKQLSEAKLAMTMYKPELAPKFNVIGELLEQQTIGAKHITDIERNEAQRLITSLRELHRDPRSIETLTAATESLFGQEALQDIQIKMGKESWTMKGLESKRMWEDVRTALTTFRSGPEKKVYEQMVLGNISDISATKMSELIKQARISKIEPLSALAFREVSTPQGFAARTAQKTTSAINRFIKEAPARSWGKPILYGLAATAGLSMIMSAPKEQPLIPPPPSASMTDGSLYSSQYASQIASANMRGISPQERDLRPESIPIPGGVSSEPSPPGMMSPETYLTQSPGMRRRSGYTYAVNARSGDMGMPDNSSISGVLSQINPGSRININIRDNRQALTSQRISDILGGF